MRSRNSAGFRSTRCAPAPRRFSSRSSAAERSACSRPFSIRSWSTAPIRPANVVKTGVPSATASRFIVPPAETTRSASATRLCASMACSGRTSEGSPRAAIASRCSARAREDDGLDRLVRAEPAEHVGEQRALVPVVEGDVGRSPDDGDRPVVCQPEVCKDGGVRLEAREIVLLLQARVAAHFRGARAEPVEALLRDRVRHHDAPRRAAAEPMLYAREFVVECVRGRDAERSCGEGELVGGVRERKRRNCGPLRNAGAPAAGKPSRGLSGVRSPLRAAGRPRREGSRARSGARGSARSRAS